MDRFFRRQEIEMTVLKIMRDRLMQTMIQLSSKATQKFNDSRITSTIETAAPFAIEQVWRCSLADIFQAS